MKKLQNWILKRVFKYVLPENTLRIVKGKMYLKGNMLPEIDAKQMITEAKDIKKMLIWNTINNNVQYSVQEAMFKNYTKHDDMIAGKSMLAIIDSYKQVVDLIGNSKLDYKEK